MKVFRVEPDVDRFQWFQTDERLNIPVEMESFDATPRGATWHHPDVYVLKPKLTAGDFFGFTSAGTIVASPEAYARVEPFFAIAGEVLPLRFGGRDYQLLNVLQCVDVVDKERSEWVLSPEGERVLLVKYAFHGERLPTSSLFKVPERRHTLLTYERSGSPAEEFKAFVEQNGMTGLIFNLVWNSD